MSGTVVSVVAVAVLLLSGVLLETSARRSGSPATLSRTLRAAMRSAPGRAVVLLTWAWLGVHFLAR